jgi:hypothetical protein
MSNIAIIGTEAAGKTVFVTVLTRRLNQRPEKGLLLDPEPKTFKHIETIWHKLNHREWPKRTDQGQSVDLRWRVILSLPGGLRTGEMRVIDASGHDIRPIFADDNVLALDAMPPAQRLLVEYCRSADIVVFVADLNHYIEKPDSDKHINEETILKSAMDFLRKHSRKYCLVLTKWDQYRDYIAQEGGWEAVSRRHLSSIYRSHLASGIPCFHLACVNKTETIIDRDATGNDERTRTVPAPGFDSEGLDLFLDWLTESVTPPPSPPAPPAPPPAPPTAWELWPLYIAGFLGVGTFLATCSKVVTVRSPWPFVPDKTHTEFDGTSIGIALIVFSAVWGVLELVRAIHKKIVKRSK